MRTTTPKPSDRPRHFATAQSSQPMTEQFSPAYFRTIKLIDGFTEWTGNAFAWLIVPLTLAVFWEVFTRYVLNNSAAWTEEIARYLLIATVFTGATIGGAAVASATPDGYTLGFFPIAAAAPEVFRLDRLGGDGVEAAQHQGSAKKRCGRCWPPPPAAAFTSTGYSTSAANFFACSTDVMSPSLPGTVGTFAAFATVFDLSLLPSASIAPTGGPMNSMPDARHCSANLLFSDRNPYPGWLACASRGRVG